MQTPIQNLIQSPIIVALDYPNATQARRFVEKVTPNLCRLKVGKELFTAEGPGFVRELVGMGFDIFLDLKFHDIPNTVAKAVAVAADLGVWMTNVHASGGARMMAAARESLQQQGGGTLLTAVTVLTSFTEQDLAEVGIKSSAADQVLHLASLAHSAGLDGVVCSAQEAQMLRAQLDKPFTLVTPGIRPADAAGDDQRRVVTPKQAISNGSDYLVIGRPVTQSEDPQQQLIAIIEEVMHN